MVINLLESLNEPVDVDSLQLSQRLTEKLERLCRHSAEQWAAQCPSLLQRSCTNYLAERSLGSLDTFTNQFGSWFESILGPGRYPMSSRCHLCERMCRIIVDASCTSSAHLSRHCRADAHVTRFVDDYRSLTSSLRHLHSAINVNSSVPALGNFFAGRHPMNLSFFHVRLRLSKKKNHYY